VEDMLAAIDAQPHDDWVRVGAALHRCDQVAGLEIWDRWSATAPNYCGREEIERRWASFDADRPNAAGAGTIVALAKLAGYDGPVYSERERQLNVEALGVSLDGFQLEAERELPLFVSLAELKKHPELLQPPKVVVPRLAWKGRTTGLVGGDKSGKSTLMGHAVSCVTRGVTFLGEPCEAGDVLIVAPDEAVGDTVQRLIKWEADETRVRLLTSQPQRLIDRLREEMDQRPPAFLLIDSLAEWSRLVEGRAPDDGDAAGWGAVIRPLVQLSRDYSCATVLLHHSRRSDGQFRGSGEIAAALDCLIEMRPGGAEEDPTTRKFSGRARWPIEPFELRMVGDEYVIGDQLVLSLETRIMMDLSVAGPSSRNAQLKRIGGRKDTYLTTVYELLERGELFEKDGLLHHGAEKQNVN
ncbi:MAG TPA: AAA family ATPase, partial [Acidimicrobiia bacterium]